MLNLEHVSSNCMRNTVCWFSAESYGLPYLSAFLDSLGSNFSHGANFATAGATIRPQNTTMAQSGYSPISLDVQSVQFSDFHRRSQIFNKQGGSHPMLIIAVSFLTFIIFVHNATNFDYHIGVENEMGLFQNLEQEGSLRNCYQREIIFLKLCTHLILAKMILLLVTNSTWLLKKLRHMFLMYWASSQMPLR